MKIELTEKEVKATLEILALGYYIVGEGVARKKNVKIMIAPSPKYSVNICNLWKMWR